MKKFIILLISLPLLVASCSNSNSLETAENQIREADLYYSGISEQQGFHAALIAMFDTNGVLLRDGHFPITGIGSIKEVLSHTLDTAYIVTWLPLEVTVAASLDFGYSYGTYRVQSRNNQTKLGDGTYTTIWKKNAKNEWRAVLDTGTSGLGTEK